MIDTHAHLVTGDTAAYPPSPPGGMLKLDDLHNPMTVEQLISEMDRNGVSKAVLVQRGSIYGFDSSYVCDSAARFPDRLTAVCSIDATQADCAERVRYWIKDRGASGIRLMELTRGSDISWLDGAHARGAWAEAVTLGVPVCVHLFPWNRVEGLIRLANILAAFPKLELVIDHFAAIKSDAGPPDHGVDALLEDVAAYEGATIKFTTIPLGRLAEADLDFRPIVRRVADLFGPARMMWGSDITQSAGTYDYMVDLGRRAVELFSSAEQEQILARTPQRLYGKGWR